MVIKALCCVAVVFATVAVAGIGLRRRRADGEKSGRVTGGR